jgi:hypothetical protein
MEFEQEALNLVDNLQLVRHSLRYQRFKFCKVRHADFLSSLATFSPRLTPMA